MELSFNDLQQVRRSLKRAPETIGNQSKAGFSIQDKDSNTSNREPPRKPLLTYFRIGSAPIKPAKPEHLKFRLKKYQDKIILVESVTTAAITSKEGRLKSKTPVNMTTVVL